MLTMTGEELDKIYRVRPFRTRNADEFELQNILGLFIDPTDGLTSPFDYCNSIIKGKMGSGKTMYLRANHAYYLYTLVPCLNANENIILPIYIKLSDFANIRETDKIYNAIIVKIVEEIAHVCDHLKSSIELTKLHIGASSLPGLWPNSKAIDKVLSDLHKLTADEYVETISNSLTGNGGITSNFFNACAEYSNGKVQELKRHDVPSFQWIVNACETLVIPFGGKLLILLDEVGSISKSFFKSDNNSESLFETLLNQLRTLPYVRTKIAVYPHSVSDILPETRYGDCIELECDPVNNLTQYGSFLSKVASLIERYIEKEAEIKCHAEDVFEITVQNQILLEQLVNASEGNMRRLVHILDMSMDEAYKRCQGRDKVSLHDVLEALKRQGIDMESLYQDSDIDYLNRLVKVCKNRSTYRFTFPNKANTIIKYTNRSAEYNIINIRQAGTGRQGTIYSFDYAYCVYKDLPTHYVKGSEKIDRTRSNEEGEPIRRVAQLSDEVLLQSEIHGKIEGTIQQYNSKGDWGIVQGDDGKGYFISREFVIESDRKKPIRPEARIRFLPFSLSGEKATLPFCTEIEIL